MASVFSIDGVLLPNKPISNFEIENGMNKLGVPGFQGVFVRDILPNKPKRTESGVLNLADSSGNGTHWVAWFKRNGKNYYFDSFGIQPPIELVIYLRPPILYNTEKIQSNEQVLCGHLRIYVLKQAMLGRDLQEILNDLH